MQKLTVLFLACLMLIFVVPVWIFPEADPPSAEGDFVRLLPVSSTYSSKQYNDSSAVPVGNGSVVCLKFNLSRFSKISPDEIKNVKLRLTFINGNGAKRGTIYIGSFTDNDKNLFDKSLPLCPAPTKLEVNHLSADNQLIEVDLTEYTKNLLNKNTTDISFMIYSNDTIPTSVATAENEDSTYRPYLKIITGMAYDEDSDSIKKAEITDCTYVSEAQPDKRGISLTSDKLTVGNGNEVYIKLKLNRAAIRDTLYSARLCLNTSGMTEPLNVSVVYNNEWSSELISYSSRPRGKESISTKTSRSYGDAVFIDISQQICDAVAKSDIITLKITSPTSRESNIFGMLSDFKPKVYIKASANEEIKCAQTAALNALGKNISSYVMTNLCETYYGENGKAAHLNWSERVQGKGDVHIRPNGEVIRPKWFEGDLNLTVQADIKCGDYSISRVYNINIAAENAPDYSKYTFSNYIDIGNSQSEEEQKFESINLGSSKRQRVNGKMFTYRTPENGGLAVLNFLCTPNAQNYLTLKFRRDNKTSGKIYISTLPNSDNTVELSVPEFEAEQSKRFVYATYAIPREYTDGRQNLSLRISFETLSDNVEQADIYAAYLTQSPYFEPKQFTKQGEVIINEPSGETNAAKEFIASLRAFSMSGTDIDDVELLTEAPKAPKSLYTITDNTIIFDNEDINAAFSFNEEQNYVDIYQKASYYDRYCAHCPLISRQGLIMTDYGDYKLIYNKYSDKEEKISRDNLEFSGIYKDMVSGQYYSFSDDWKRSDDSAIPETASVYDGDTLSAQPGQILLLMRVSEPLGEADWRISMINGTSVSELINTLPDTIENISFKAAGGFPYGVEEANVIICVFSNAKLVEMYKETVNITESIPMYTIDLSKNNISLANATEVRFFITDTQDLTPKRKPKLELP